MLKHKMIILLLFFATQSLLKISSGFDITNAKLFRNMPQKGELTEYIKNYNSATEYSLNNEYEVDSNLALGVFIAEGKICLLMF